MYLRDSLGGRPNNVSTEGESMEYQESEIPQLRLIGNVLLRAILPTAFSALIGFFFFHWFVLNIHYPTFQFVSVAVVASVFFYSIVYLGRRDSFAVLLILFVLVSLLSGSTRLMWVLRDFVDTCGIAAAVLLYARLHRKSPGLRHQYFGLVFSGILGVCSILAWSLQFFFVRVLFRDHQLIAFLDLVYTAGFRGFLVGFGVGAGIALNQKLFGPASEKQAKA